MWDRIILAEFLNPVLRFLERLQVKFFVFKKSAEIFAIWRQNWLYAMNQKQTKTSNNAQI